MLLLSSFDLFSFGLWTNATLLKTLKYSTFGFSPLQAWRELNPSSSYSAPIFLIGSCDHRFYPQAANHALLCNIHQAISTKIWLNHFVTPLDCGLYGAMSYYWMPFTLQWLLKALKLNPPPLSLLTYLKSSCPNYSPPWLRTLWRLSKLNF